MLWICLALLAFAAIAVFAIGDAGTIAGFNGEMIAGLAAMLALLIYIGGSALSAYRGRLSSASRDLAIWLGLILVLIAGYSFRHEAGFVVERVTGELLPPGRALNLGTQPAGRRAVRIRRRPNGQFITDARVNGTSLSLLVDTGASSVMLTSSDARSIGVNVDRLSYSTPILTANGRAMAASIRIDSIEIGAIVIRNVDALVAKPGSLRTNLLGMSFLNRLRSFEFSRDFITLRS